MATTHRIFVFWDDDANKSNPKVWPGCLVIEKPDGQTKVEFHSFLNEDATLDLPGKVFRPPPGPLKHDTPMPVSLADNPARGCHMYTVRTASGAVAQGNSMPRMIVLT